MTTTVRRRDERGVPAPDSRALARLAGDLSMDGASEGDGGSGMNAAIAPGASDRGGPVSEDESEF